MSVRLFELPIYDQVQTDGALSERELQVWRAATKRLDVIAFRVLKHLDIERMTGIAKSTVSVALDRLCALGYLVRQRGGGNAAWEYRVPLSRAQVPDDAEATPATPGRRPRRHRGGMVSRGL